MDSFPTLGYNLWFELKPLFPHYKENKICGKKTFVMWLKFYSEAFASLMSFAWKEVSLGRRHPRRHHVQMPDPSYNQDLTAPFTLFLVFPTNSSTPVQGTGGGFICISFYSILSGSLPSDDKFHPFQLCIFFFFCLKNSANNFLLCSFSPRGK